MKLGLLLCRVGLHRWQHYVGVDLADATRTSVTARSCRRGCGHPLELVGVER